jgi:hypothetical protein
MKLKLLYEEAPLIARVWNHLRLQIDKAYPDQQDCEKSRYCVILKRVFSSDAFLSWFRELMINMGFIEEGTSYARTYPDGTTLEVWVEVLEGQDAVKVSIADTTS